jgi:hypothetical protein
MSNKAKDGVKPTLLFRPVAATGSSPGGEYVTRGSVARCDTFEWPQYGAAI